MIRGPNIRAGQTVNFPVGNIDLAPTVLDIANIPIPQRMDGRSILNLLRSDTSEPTFETRAHWRDTGGGAINALLVKSDF